MSAVVMLSLPWHNENGECFMSFMSLGTDNKPVDKKAAKRIVSQWYEESIGTRLHARVFDIIWQKRFVSKARTEQEVAEYLHNMARATYDSIEEKPDTGAQAETSGSTGR